MSALNTVQEELKPWQDHNFPGRPSWVPLLGIQEEAGELAHAYIKRHQGIRNTENHEANIRDAVADLIVFLCDFCNAEGINLEEELVKTWNQVKQRDWKKNPNSAHEQTKV